jgi:uracil phosphoribosyltransferase
MTESSTVSRTATQTRVAWDIQRDTDQVAALRRFFNPRISRVNARLEIHTLTQLALNTFGVELGDTPLLVPILRAGLAMWPAADAHFGHPRTAFAVARKTKGTDHVELSFSSGLDRPPATGLLMLDTVSATGDTVVYTASALRTLHREIPISALVCYASPQAIASIEKARALTRLYVAVRSEGVDPQGWLLPKIGGDAGEKLYGVPT